MQKHSTFPHIFSPLKIKGMELKNRLVMAPMATRYATLGGFVTPRLIQYYRTRAAGGVGLVTVEATAVSEEGFGWPNNLAVYDDIFIPGLKDLTTAIREEGSKSALEIFHAGQRARTAVILQQPIAPSGIATKNGEVPREMTLQEVEEMVEKFAQSARRAKEAGFDAVNLHMAHGYIIQQFLSPMMNQRQDAYGGNLENRCRFALDIIKRIQELVGFDYPILCRVSADEGTKAGLDIAQSQKIAVRLEEAGAHVMDISAGGPESPYLTVQSLETPKGYLVPLATQIKEVVKIPVATVGRIDHPQLAEDILAQKRADLVVMGRALLADPDLPNKAYTGKEKDIRPCIACKEGCSGRLAAGQEVSCLVNPMVGRESMIEVEKTNKPKEVLVVGAGPAGMEAARVAALRGHQVRLIEKEAQVGGQVSLAAKIPYKDDFASYIQYQKAVLEDLDVAFEYRKTFQEEDLQKYSPDVLVLALGGEPIKPDIPGIENPNVFFAWDVLRDGIKADWKKVVILGGGEVGLETAEFLLKQGLTVIIIEMLHKIALKMEARDRELLLRRIRKSTVDFFTQSQVTKIEGNTVELNRAGLLETIFQVDAVILSAGVQSRTLNLSSHPSMQVYEIGDFVTPERMFEAVHQGFSVGLKI